MEIIAPNGPLEQYLLNQKVDLKTISVHLFGSSYRGRSEHPTKNNREITEFSDEDIEKVVNALFPSVIPVNVTFYESLASLQHYIGSGTHPQTPCQTNQ